MTGRSAAPAGLTAVDVLTPPDDRESVGLVESRRALWDRLTRSLSTVGLLLVLCGLACPASALAARPVPGGRYLLFAKGSVYGITLSGVLQVSGSGRALTSDGIPFSPVWRYYFGSYLQKSLRCGSDEADAVFHLGAPGSPPVAVGSHGRFTTVAMGDPTESSGSQVVQLRGHFASRSEAVVEIVKGTFQPEGATQPCPIPHQTLHFHLRPMPPFGRCATAAGRTVLSTARSRVYKTWGVDETGRQTYAYACLRGGRPIPLGGTSYGFDGSVAKFRLAGQYASFVYGVDNEGGRTEVLGVIDLRGLGRTVRAVVPSPENDNDVNHFVANPLLAPDGSSAWVAQDCPPEHSCTAAYEVWIADGGGTRRVDPGPAVDPKSLALRGSTVVWTNGGESRSAPIGTAPSG